MPTRCARAGCADAGGTAVVRRYRIPPHAPGQRIGLFGGTFDPPHGAHLAASLLAIKRLRLDRVWWLVTPGNPLKDTSGLAPLDQRVAAARALARHPRIEVTGLEAELAARYSYDTIRYLLAHCPGVRFRVDHGGRQFAQLPPLAEMARHCGAGADRGHRSSRPQPLRHGQRRQPRARAPAHCGTCRGVAAGAASAGLGVCCTD